MYRKIAAIGAAALMLTGCVSPESSEAFQASTAFQKTQTSGNMIEVMRVKNNLQIKAMVLSANTQKIKKVVSELKSRVGKTWYVFSGATPSGWDCSGLTMWGYKQIGISLKHRASQQQDAGQIVKSPKLGDIVVFKYKGNKSAYHVGIYAGNGKMIHAGKRGELTAITSISKFAGGYSNVSFVRILDTI
jgi:cell wall-associated NlpC family hydrolase